MKRTSIFDQRYDYLRFGIALSAAVLLTFASLHLHANQHPRPMPHQHVTMR